MFDWLDITTTILGLLYILLEYRASVMLWFVGILMPALDIVLYWQHGLYGDSMLAVYYLLAAFYGFIAWTKTQTGQSQSQGRGPTITKMPRRLYLPTVLFFLTAWGATYLLLANFTNSTVPVLDAFTNALSIVGMWALARKFIEQWLFWIVVDAVCTYLYIIKDLPFKAGLYGLYVVIAIAGYYKWKKMAGPSNPLKGDSGFGAGSEPKVQGQSQSLSQGQGQLPLQEVGGLTPPSGGWGAGNCVILANGSFPKSKRALEALDAADYICCCDGAVGKLVAAGREPHAIVGDGDSIPSHLRERYAKIFTQIKEQEYNDLTKATRHCIAKGFTHITYLGATGLREDHTVGNIFLLPFYLTEFGVSARMITDAGIFRAYKGDSRFGTSVGQQISVFNISCQRLAGSGLRYPLSPFAQLWQGTLNEATEPVVEIHADGVYLVYQENASN